MRPTPQIKFTISPDIASLTSAAARIRAFLEEAGVCNATIFAMETALEEIITNAIKYGTSAQPAGPISLTITAAQDRIELVIEDRGDAFDPTKVPSPAVDCNLEDMPVGGLGIHLIRSVMDGFEYQRVNHRNQVRVWLARPE
jgi:serine/threonine-protein kinase RsbW